MNRPFLIRFFAFLGSLGIYILPLLVGLFGVIWWVESNFLAAYQEDSKEMVYFQVQPGWNLKQVSQALEEQKLVTMWESIYYLTGEKDGKQRTFVAGEYQLSASYTPKKIIEVLSSGDTVQHKVQIPAGATTKEIAALLAEKELGDEKSILAAMGDRTLLAQMGVPSFILEGYFMGGEYSFSRPIEPKAIVQRMVEHTKKTIDDAIEEWQTRAADMRMRSYDIIILASVLELESQNAEERKSISTVYHNRMQIGMPLQSDAALAYQIEDFDGEITQEQMDTPGPYNTYINTGLPSTPICSPSVESIRAALYPEIADYLYYMRLPDGSTKYFETFKKYQSALKRIEDAIING